MDMERYESLNEKLSICYKNLYLNKGQLSSKELEDIREEIKEYKEEMNNILLEK